MPKTPSPLRQDQETFLRNYSDTPLVTVQLMMCAKDFMYYPRALKSIMNQDLPPEQVEIQVLFDGEPSIEAQQIIEADSKQYRAIINFAAVKETGYYCSARNQGFVAAWGFYLAPMDVDNEMAPGHLRGLLKAIRTPDPETGWPHFVYSRREYVKDEDCYDPEGNLREGPSEFMPWNAKNKKLLVSGPNGNFIDSGDLMISRSALYELANRSGCAWNTEMRRFGDWDLAKRLAESGIRGKAVDQVTNIYHWHKSNLQTTRRISDVLAIPADSYEALKADGKIRG